MSPEPTLPLPGEPASPTPPSKGPPPGPQAGVEPLLVSRRQLAALLSLSLATVDRLRRSQ